MRILALIACGGCAYGGGAYAGYGAKRGFVAGGEAVGGSVIAQAVAGYQIQGSVSFVRGDIAAEDAYNPGTHGFGARVGGGFARSADRDDVIGVFDAGPNLDIPFHQPAPGCGEMAPTVEISVELRYLGEWQLVGAGRFVEVQHHCDN